MPFTLQYFAPDVVTIDAGETIDVRNAGVLEARGKQAIGEGVRHIVFDLTETVLVDSEGIWALIALYRRLAAEGAEEPAIVLSNVQARARTTFEVTRTERLFAFAESVEEAVEMIG